MKRDGGAQDARSPLVDSWIVGQSVDGERDYVVHLAPPRLVVACVEGADGGIDIGEIDLIDPIDDDRVNALLREALDVFARWERTLEDEDDA